ncbi:hypothetical protein FHT21_002751 [Pedobacter sp. SG908]|nr:hypothetical protein [Pedobacter sp. SG908]
MILHITLSVKSDEQSGQEQEFVSGGAVGGENFKTITSEINQLGSTKLTYVSPSLVDQKLDIRKSKKSSVYSSIATMLYNINKPVGQSLNTTAEYFGNRRPTAATIGVILTFISNFLIYKNN